jgi:hypothetical protein
MGTGQLTRAADRGSAQNHQKNHNADGIATQFLFHNNLTFNRFRLYPNKCSVYPFTIISTRFIFTRLGWPVCIKGTGFLRETPANLLLFQLSVQVKTQELGGKNIRLCSEYFWDLVSIVISHPLRLWINKDSLCVIFGIWTIENTENTEHDKELLVKTSDWTRENKENIELSATRIFWSPRTNSTPTRNKPKLSLPTSPRIAPRTVKTVNGHL